jgi:hypothetical protein
VVELGAQYRDGCLSCKDICANGDDGDLTSQVGAIVTD